MKIYQWKFINENLSMKIYQWKFINENLSMKIYLQKDLLIEKSLKKIWFKIIVKKIYWLKIIRKFINIKLCSI